MAGGFLSRVALIPRATGGLFCALAGPLDEAITPGFGRFPPAPTDAMVSAAASGDDR